MKKNHEMPEFQVIMQSEANAKFFVASLDGYGNSAEVSQMYGDGLTTMQKNNWNNM